MSTSFSEGKVRVAIGVVGLAVFGYYLWEAGQMPMGETGSPGPGLFPTMVGALGVAVSGLVVVDALTKRERENRIELPGKRVLTKIVLFAGTLIGFVVLLPVLGQYVASTLFCVASIKIIGNGSWFRSFFAGALIAISLSWAFLELFSIPLPSGVLF